MNLKHLSLCWCGFLACCEPPGLYHEQWTSPVTSLSQEPSVRVSLHLPEYYDFTKTDYLVFDSSENLVLSGTIEDTFDNLSLEFTASNQNLYFAVLQHGLATDPVTFGSRTLGENGIISLFQTNDKQEDNRVDFSPLNDLFYSFYQCLDKIHPEKSDNNFRLAKSVFREAFGFDWPVKSKEHGLLDLINLNFSVYAERTGSSHYLNSLAPFKNSLASNCHITDTTHQKLGTQILSQDEFRGQFLDTLHETLEYFSSDFPEITHEEINKFIQKTRSSKNMLFNFKSYNE